MAIDNRLQVFNEEGQSVDYDILASDVKFLPDGKDLPTKLTEMEDAIEDAAEGGGYTPPQGGIPKTDLAPSVQTSLGLADTALQEADKAQLQTAIDALTNTLNTLIGSGNVQGVIDTFNEVKAFLSGIDTSDPTLANQLLALNNAISTVQESLAAKANSTDVYTKTEVDTKVADAGKVKSVSVNNGTHEQPDANGNVNLTVAAGADTDIIGISVPSPYDGTVVFTKRNNDTVTVNLNHTHPQYLKYELLADEAAYNALATKDSSTLYLIPES